jgi:hypothetical protein
MPNAPLTLRSLLLLAARLTLYMGIALLAMAVCHVAVLGAFSMLHPLSVR